MPEQLVIGTTPDAVRAMHASMYRRLRRHMEVHRQELSPEGWALLTRVAFALYVDSREREPEPAAVAIAVAEPA